MTDREKRAFREMLGGGRFAYGAELVSSRGVPEPGRRAAVVELGEALAADPRVAWVSITDNPGGHPMLPADWLFAALEPTGTQVVIHLTCKDQNRNGLESSAWRYAAEGCDNILALTGDHPAGGHMGRAQAVFDLDSVSLITLLRQMNEGLEAACPDGRTARLAPTRFFIGCAVSPFKRHEREVVPQYLKLARKIRSGAGWAVSQLGYDMRKFQEIKLFLDRAGLGVPLVGNAYMLSRPVARLFNTGALPGCVVSDALLEQVERYAGGADKGRAFFIELAAKQLAVFKGLGFAAGYLGGAHKASTFAKIIDLAESFGSDNWREFARTIQFPQPGEFYLFEQDPATGLGDGERVNRDYLQSQARGQTRGGASVGYRLARAVHRLAFTPGEGLFPAVQGMYGRLERNRRERTLAALHGIERVSKAAMYGCKDCGDCSLPDIAYLCPRSACSKTTRNGPCGGSADGRCELGDKACIWTRAYNRLKPYGESERMLDGPPVFADAALSGTSAWANTFMGRDHHHHGPEAARRPAAHSDAEPGGPEPGARG